MTNQLKSRLFSVTARSLSLQKSFYKASSPPQGQIGPPNGGGGIFLGIPPLPQFFGSHYSKDTWLHSAPETFCTPQKFSKALPCSQLSVLQFLHD